MAEQPQGLPPAYTDRSESPPPKYKAKRTPSQEEIYIRELKLWAAEKAKMNPGAYGEYFHGVSEPQRGTVGRHEEERTLAGGRGPHTTSGETSNMQTTVEPQESVVIPHGTARRDSVQDFPGCGAEGGTLPKTGSFRRRMSSFMKKLGTIEDKTGSTDMTTGTGTERPHHFD